MTREAILGEFRKLPRGERIELMEQLWEEFDPAPFPDWHEEELNRRLDDPTEVANIAWEEPRDRLAPPRW